MEKIIKHIKPTPTKEIALKKLETLGLPTKKTEEYRYFDLRDMMDREWDIYQEKAKDIKETKEITIVDGVLKTLPKGVDLEILFNDNSKLDIEHFDAIYYLSHALSLTNLQITFKKDCDITIRQIFTKKYKVIPYRVSFIIPNSLKVKVTDIVQELDSSDNFVCSGFDIDVLEGATFTLLQEKTTSKNNSVYIFSHKANIAKNATFNLHTFDFGEGRSLQTIKIDADENATANAYHLLFAKGSSNIGTVSKINHIGKNSKSNQKAKNILQDDAKGIFDALIYIKEGVPECVAHQNSQAILLNDGAFMASKPQLEIYADEVEASHGSTIGELDKDQLFYLRTRGISEEEAKKLLILAFANEMIDAIEDENTKEFLHQSFDSSYYNIAHIECISSCHNCEDMILQESK